MRNATFFRPKQTALTTYHVPPYSDILPGPMDLSLDLRAARETGALGWGTEIAAARVELGYNYVGLEDGLAGGGTQWEGALGLVGELCGCCSQANMLAFVQAVESMGSVSVPTRALYMRLLLVETERIISHLLNAANVMQELHLPDREASLRDLREQVIVAVEEWSGDRRPGLITFGGLVRNIGEAPSKALAEAARNVERALRTQVTDIINSREIARRLTGLGRITPQEALVAGLRGPVARASGVTIDLRANVPTGAYETEGVTIISQRGGDVFSRVVVRLLECLESFRAVEQALDDLPPGPVKVREGFELRDGSAVGRVEGPRGEVFCWVRGDSSGVSGLHLSTGSFPSVSIIPGLLSGAGLDNVKLVLLSLDLCLSSIER